MKKNKRFICSTICFMIILFQFFPVRPARIYAKNYWPQGPEVLSSSAYVLEMNTGTVLYEKNGNRQYYPASITKIMTTLLAVENCDMDETVVFSEDAVYKNEGDTSHISRDVDEKMTMEQCLYAIMLASANECSYAVAEHVGKKTGGDYRSFIDMMNKKAGELGCTETHFNNCNGLPDQKHLTSAHDMALIAQEAYKNETFRMITGTGKYVIPPTNKHSEETPLRNHHGMLYPYRTSEFLYEYCTGGKTGYTDAAKNTLVTYAEKDGMALVCVIMNANASNQYIDTHSLLDYYFNNFQALNIADNEDRLADSKIATGILNDNASFVSLDDNAYIIMPKGVDFSEAKYELDRDENRQEIVAELSYIYAEHNVGSVELVPSGAQVKNDLFNRKNSSDSKNANSEPDKKVIVIKPIYILVGIIVITGLILLYVILKKMSDTVYLHRLEKEMRRVERERFRVIRKRHRKPRKKDSIFR